MTKDQEAIIDAFTNQMKLNKGFHERVKILEDALVHIMELALQHAERIKYLEEVVLKQHEEIIIMKENYGRRNPIIESTN